MTSTEYLDHIAATEGVCPGAHEIETLRVWAEAERRTALKRKTKAAGEKANQAWNRYAAAVGLRAHWETRYLPRARRMDSAAGVTAQ